MTLADLLRAARDLESQGLDLEADRLRWQAERLAAELSRRPALDSSSLSAALREAEALGDLPTVARLSGFLASLAA